MSVLEFTVPPGPLVSQQFPSPAAGAEFTITTPDTEAAGMWQVVSIRARFVASATVVNRFPALAVKDENGTEVYRIGFETAITNGLTIFCTFTPAVGSIQGGVANSKALAFPLPGGPYPSRTAFTSITTGIDAGDQWSQLAILYQRFTPNLYEE